MNAFIDVVRDIDGVIVAGANVYIYGPDGQEAELFAPDGVTPAENPLISDDKGEVSAKITDDGFYTARYYWGGRKRYVEKLLLGQSPIDQAEAFAASAEAASGPTYVSTAAGLAATTSGQAFAVNTGDGIVSVYRNTAGSAVLQRSIGTTTYNDTRFTQNTDLASTATSKGAALVGISSDVTYGLNTVGSWSRAILNRGVAINFEGSGSDAGLIKPFIWYNPIPTATDVADFGILRRSATGGSAGVTNSAFRVIHVAQAGTASFEWASLSIMENNATAGENVAGYWQGKKNSTGPTWAGVLEAIDTTGTANPTTGLVGAEVDVRANGTDGNNNRVGVDVVVTRPLVAGVPTGTAMQASFGFRVQSSGDASATVKIGFGFANTTKVVTAFDCSTAEVSGDAVKIASGQTISFDENSQHRMRYQSTVGLTYGAGGVDQSSLRHDGTIWSRPLTFATLPAAGVFGRKAVISDCTTTTFNAAAAGGGANKVPVFDDGAAWRVG